MTNTKKIFITHESHEVVTMRPVKSMQIGFCSDCGGQTGLLTLDESVSSAHVPARLIIRKIESGEVHSIETARGHMLICHASLTANIREK
jgi:hypothetical protein